MKKVTRQAVQAFYNNVNFRSGNTIVSNGKMYLHGNLIAKKENGAVYISNAGWATNTTKERLNGLSGVHINQKNFVWYLNGKEWNGTWTKI